MTNTENKLTETAKTLYEAFETKKRDKGDEFVSLRLHSPQWIINALRVAHDNGDIFPNDWIYAEAEAIAGNMVDAEPDDWDELVSEWADQRVDIYNNARTAWLASHLAFGAIVDEAVEELGHSDQGIFGDIGLGQYRLLERIAAALISAVREQVDA